MTAPGLSPGHSFFAYGECPHCTKAPKVQAVSASGFSEVAVDIKRRRTQHMLDKHGFTVGIDDVSVVVLSAASYDAPESERMVHTEDPSAAALPAPAFPPAPALPPAPAGPAGHPGGAPPWRDWDAGAARSRSRSRSPAREREIPREVLDLHVVLRALRNDLAVSLTSDGQDFLNVSDLSDGDLRHLLLKVSAELYRRGAAD